MMVAVLASWLLRFLFLVVDFFGIILLTPLLSSFLDNDEGTTTLFSASLSLLMALSLNVDDIAFYDERVTRSTTYYYIATSRLRAMTAACPPAIGHGPVQK